MTRLPFRRIRLPLPLSRALQLGALALVAGLPAAAQEPDRFARLDPSSRFTIEAMIDSAKNEGLPDGVLRLKALEGISKKVDGRRIVQGVQKKLVLLRVAHSVLGAVGGEELDAAAAVLEAGAKPAQLAAFKNRQKGRSDLDAFTVWADLISRGVPSEEASSAITKLWQDGADDATFRRLWNDVQADISQGLNPGAALQNRVRQTPVQPASKPATPPEG